MQTLKIINDNIRKISETNTLLDMLLEFEGVLDTFDIYAYKNWKKGEVIAGPKLGRYFIEVALNDINLGFENVRQTKGIRTVVEVATT